MRSLWHLLPAVTLILAGCASTNLTTEMQGPAPAPAPVELDTTPFYPQQAYQCGPAALATVLSATGKTVAPQALTEKIYLPERRGSLQAELIAASRRYDRVPYLLPPTPAALIKQLQAGYPVLVLQNLGIALIPRWHYAVVIGYKPDTGQLILRSGRQRRKLMDIDLFLRTWHRADDWALVVLPPERLPADPDPRRYLEAVAGLESTGHLAAAVRGYTTASRHWPDLPAVWYGLGNAHYLNREFAEADTAYRRALALTPDNAAVRNNLAQSLLARGCHQAAADTVAAALELDDIAAKIREALQDTQRQIQNQQGKDMPPTADCPAAFP